MYYILKIKDKDTGEWVGIPAIQGPAGKDGKDGSNGTDGKTPVKGTDYWTAEDKAEMVAEVLAGVEGKEDSSNKVTSIDASSTDEQYPSAKAVFDLMGSINTMHRGPYIITETQEFDLSALGIQIGDFYTVACVGAGGGGQGGGSGTAGAGGTGGESGGNSSKYTGGAAGAGYGAGGGGGAPFGSYAGGEGGASGKAAIKTIQAEELVIAVTIGNPGGGGAATSTGRTGTAGGTTSFGTLLSADGGSGGGQTFSGGVSGSAATTTEGGKGGDGWTHRDNTIEMTEVGAPGPGAVFIWW